ncbi:DUF5615 family PIN-like protein [Desulfococcaceae bacterium HSG9]|nr:DUF5615 family PIN-like protein [Desulfococcaceae bacterium HSG9]
MKLFIDQMIDRDIIVALRAAGYDVECTSEKGMARSDDLEILKYCTNNKRTLVTLDEHFGDWTVIKLTEHAGVIRLKVNPTSSSMIKDALFPFLEQNKDREFQNLLVIVKDSGIRWIRTA